MKHKKHSKGIFDTIEVRGTLPGKGKRGSVIQAECKGIQAPPIYHTAYAGGKVAGDIHGSRRVRRSLGGRFQLRQPIKDTGGNDLENLLRYSSRLSILSPPH